MLRISKKADYAVFLLGAIARQGAYPGGSAPTSVVSAHEIAKQAGLNKSVVANLLKEYAKHGLLESVRGLKGGYRLVRAPKDISLGEVLEVVEGKFTLVDCIGAERVHAFASLAAGEPTGQRAGERTAPAARADRGATALAGEPETSSVHAGHDCALIGFCPSRNPMRIVHERISKLFREIRLDELCNLGTVQSGPPPMKLPGR